MLQAHAVEYAVIVLYLIFMLITGFAFRRFIHNFSDYFRSGCRGTWWLVGASVFMVSFSAWSFTGAAGVAYQSGLTVAVIFLSNAIGYLLNFFFTAHLFRQLRATTGPEIIGERFGTITQQAYVWIGVPPGILMASLTLLGVAVFTSAVFGFSIQAVIVVLGLVVLLYATIGGSWSVMATDFLQALILMPLALLITCLSLYSIGGIGGLLSEIQRQELPHLLSLVDTQPGAAFSPSWAAAMLVFVIITYNSLGAAPKFFACKDGREARKAALLASALMLFGAILWFIPPIVARLQFPELVEAQNIPKPAEAAYAVIALRLLPRGLAGLIVVAMFSATMSSLDSQLNQFAAVITQDVYRPFFRRRASEREIFIVGQIASLLIGVLIILSALNLSRKTGSGLFDYMLQFGSLLGTPMVIPMFLALFARKTPPWAALISIAGSFVLSYLGWKLQWPYQKNVFFILMAGSLSYLATLPFWQFSTREYQERVLAFYRRMFKPVHFEQEVGQANDASQLKIVGYVSLTIGLFISLLSILPNPWTGRLQILLIACCVALFGISMVLTGSGYWLKRNESLKQRSLQSDESARKDSQ